MRRVRLLAAMMSLVVLVGFGWREASRWPGGATVLHVLDVGQGDGILLTTEQGHVILVDGGPDWSVLQRLGEALPFFHRSIDALVLTHTDLDHIAGFPEILERYHVGMLILGPHVRQVPWFERTLASARERGTRIINVVAGQTLQVGEDAHLDVLWPPRDVDERFLRAANDTSLVLMLRTGSASVLFTGDIEEPVERTLVMAGVDLHATVLKVPHHGSATSSSTGFLLAVAPSTAVASLGRQNSYGHPHPAVVARYQSLGIVLRQTDLEGTVRLELAP